MQVARKRTVEDLEQAPVRVVSQASQGQAAEGARKKRLNPQQDPVERRGLRQQYSELIENLTEQKNEYVALESTKLRENLERANTLFEKGTLARLPRA
jgi:hypothetical protein